MAKILVVDDEERLRTDIIEVLTFEDFETIGAPNGVAGIEAARREKPDLIVCDVTMPEMDGYEMLAQLRSDDATATIPFIFLTAKSGPDDVREGMKFGADDYLTKPFTIERLLEAVRVRLDKHRVFKELEARNFESLRDSVMMSLPHEFRTPLTGILGFADLMVADAHNMDPDQVATMAQYIIDGAVRLHRLVENYLIYAQVEMFARDAAQQEKMRRHRTQSPDEAIEHKAFAVAQEKHREGDLSVNLVADAPVQIHDEYTRKIVNELLDNAFKFSDEGTPVNVESFLNGDYYVVSITNHGRGMTPEEIERIGAFIQFNRRIYEQQGIGLGLSIVHRLAELHGGKLVVESTPDETTTVSAYLPLANA